MDWKANSSGTTVCQIPRRVRERYPRQRWRALYDQVRLSGDQEALLRGFVRQMNILCVTGMVRRLR